MELEDLPGDWKEWAEGIQRDADHGQTTALYLIEALKTVKDLREFKKSAYGILISTKDEIDFDLHEIDNMEVMQRMCLLCLQNKKVNELCVHYLKRVIGECKGLTRVAGSDGG
jgi:hypothetical protein